MMRRPTLGNLPISSNSSSQKHTHTHIYTCINWLCVQNDSLIFQKSQQREQDFNFVQPNWYIQLCFTDPFFFFLVTEKSSKFNLFAFHIVCSHLKEKEHQNWFGRNFLETATGETCLSTHKKLKAKKTHKEKTRAKFNGWLIDSPPHSVVFLIWGDGDVVGVGCGCGDGVGGGGGCGDGVGGGRGRGDGVGAGCGDGEGKVT